MNSTVLVSMNDVHNVSIRTAETNDDYILQQSWKKYKHENTQALGFKRPRNLLVPGKNWLMKNLLAWLKNADSVCARVIFGGNGQEKIGLVLELCEAAENLGWYVGAVTTTMEVSRFENKRNLQEWDWSRPALVVADYAEQRVKHLHNQFEELVKKSKAKASPKLLLLENCKSHSADWMLCVF